MFVEFKTSFWKVASSRKEGEDEFRCDIRASGGRFFSFGVGWLAISPSFGEGGGGMMVRRGSIGLIGGTWGIEGAFGMGMSVAPPLRSRTSVIVKLGLAALVCERGILRTGCDERTKGERCKRMRTIW